MGTFLNVTALRTDDHTAVVEAIVRFAADHGVVAQPRQSSDDDYQTAATVVPPTDGWVIVIWPKYTLFLIKATVRLSIEVDAPASAVNIYDSDCWYHVAVEAGQVRDRYHSDPRYQVSPQTTLAEQRRRWAGNPRAVGDLFGRDPKIIAPYFQPPLMLRLRHFWRSVRPNYDGRAYPDDKEPLDGDWVFADLWRRLGIAYPDATQEQWRTFPTVQFATINAPPFPYDTVYD